MGEHTLLITGASSGIGEATARAAVEAGWKVALAARSKDKLDALIEDLGADKAIAIACDVSNEDQVKSMVEEANAFAPLGAVFANAGLGASKPGSIGGDVDNWRQMVETNIWGLLLTVRYSLPLLKENGNGHMVLTGSRAGRNLIKGSVYGATKWFVHGYGQNLALEMAEWGGRCTVIAPGMVGTPFFDTPKPDALKAEDVANAVIYALQQPPHVSIGEVLMVPVQP